MLNLIAFNRWWDAGKVEDVHLKPYKRALFYDLIKGLDSRQVLLMCGLRRVGKTTLMYQMIDYLLRKGENKKNILYFSFDERIASLEEVIRSYSDFVLGKDILKRGRVYIFLDEIQKLKDWQNHLKIFYDLYPNLKFIVSGSASLAISKGARESLAGRVFEYLLPLMSFFEYLSFLGEELPPQKNLEDFSFLKELYLKKERLSPLFFSYIKNGGFIEIVKEEDDFKIREYSRSILERVIFSDIPQGFKIKEPQILMSILELVGSNPGFLLDYSKLAQVFHRDQRVISNYIFYLTYSLMTKLLYNFSVSKFASERKLKKIYLASTNFIYFFNKEKFFDAEFMGKIVESLLVVFSKSKFFWRERGDEVDVVLENRIPLEIKYSEKILKKEDLKGLLKFVRKFNSQKAIVLTADELREEKIDGIPVWFIPAWLYLLCSG